MNNDFSELDDLHPKCMTKANDFKADEQRLEEDMNAKHAYNIPVVKGTHHGDEQPSGHILIRLFQNAWGCPGTFSGQVYGGLS